MMETLHSINFSKNEKDSCLGDHKPIVAKLEPCAEFHKDEDQEPSFQVCSLVSSINNDKIQHEEQHINDVDLNQ
jgi:hypothetical protein